MNLFGMILIIKIDRREDNISPIKLFVRFSVFLAAFIRRNNLDVINENTLKN